MKTKQKISFADLLFFCLLAAACLGLGRHLFHNVPYNWQWELIPQFLIYIDQTTGSWKLNSLLLGFLTTIRLSFWAILLALPLATGIALCHTGSSLYLHLLAKTYIGTIRNIPPIIVIFIFYFFLGDQVLPNFGPIQTMAKPDSITRTLMTIVYCPPEQFTAFTAAVLSLAILEAAYLAEIIRSGLENVEKGQWEAALGAGFSKWQALYLVIFPQAIPLILPPLTGQCISTIKDSAIVSVISIQELTFQGTELTAATYMTFEIWITVTLLYFVLTFSCSRLLAGIERKINNTAWQNRKSSRK